MRYFSRKAVRARSRRPAAPPPLRPQPRKNRLPPRSRPPRHRRLPARSQLRPRTTSPQVPPRPGRYRVAAPARSGSGAPDWSPGAYRAVGGASRVEPYRLPDRRKFLQAATGTAAASPGHLRGQLLHRAQPERHRDRQGPEVPGGRLARLAAAGGTSFKIPGLSSFITPNSNFYRVDTAIVLPEIEPSTWHLRIHGMVEKEIVLSFHDVLKQPLIEDYVTLCCVSNWVGGPYIGNAKWLGVSLGRLLRQAGIKAGADQLFCTSSDGFTSGTPVQTAMDGRDAMLAVAMNDAALPVAHGFPARLVIPGLYGYVSACKWITDIEVTTYQSNVSYWAQRGWDAQAPIKTESRIDVPTGNNPVKAGKTIQVAGVAWAQHKGIDAVEVRIAKGPWQQARLAAVPGIDCWRQWVYDWDVSVRPGNYLIESRATDKTGYTQTSLQEPPEPNGASGYPSVSVSVTS